MKTIGFLISDISNFGGTQKVLSLLSNEFVKNDVCNVIVFTLTQMDTVKFELDSRIKIIVLDIEYSKLSLYKIIFRLNEKVSKYNVDIVLGMGVYLSIILPFINCKTIACEHNSYDIVGRLTEITRSLAYRFVDCVVSLTNEDREKLIRINKNTIVIPNPLESSKSHKITNSMRDKTIISVGSINERKGIDRLINIWERIERDNTGYNLKIFGEGEEKENLQEKCRLLGLKTVFFKGNSNNIEQELSKARVFTLTSHKEGFPMVLLEAMGSGVPCISFDIKTGPNEIIINGVDGYLIDDGDESSYYEKLLSLINNVELQNNMSNMASKNISRFSLIEITEKWRVLFGNI